MEAIWPSEKRKQTGWDLCYLFFPRVLPSFQSSAYRARVASGCLTGLKRERQESGTCQNDSTEMRMEGEFPEKGRDKWWVPPICARLTSKSRMTPKLYVCGSAAQSQAYGNSGKARRWAEATGIGERSVTFKSHQVIGAGSIPWTTRWSLRRATPEE